MTMSSDEPLSPLETVVATAMAKNGKRLDVEEISRDTAVSQDAGIDGIDMYGFVQHFGDGHRDVLKMIPRDRFSDQRAAFYGYSGFLLFPVWLLRPLLTWPGRREPPIPPLDKSRERLTVAHLAAVLKAGAWFEPTNTVT